MGGRSGADDLGVPSSGRQPFVPDRLRSVLSVLADAAYYAVLALAGVAMVRWALAGGRQAAV